jgi:hypothetical protein
MIGAIAPAGAASEMRLLTRYDSRLRTKDYGKRNSPRGSPKCPRRRMIPVGRQERGIASSAVT